MATVREATAYFTERMKALTAEELTIGGQLEELSGRHRQVSRELAQVKGKDLKRTGEILVETKAPLCEEAMEVCGSFFHYSLETGISSDLRRDGYVKAPQNLPAVNTRDRTYFSLAAEPEDFAKAVESLSVEQSEPSL